MIRNKLITALLLAIPLIAQDPFPSNTVAHFDTSSCPTGWAPFTNAQGRTIVHQDSSAGVATAVGRALANGQDPSHRHRVADSVSLGNVQYLLVAGGCCNNNLTSRGTKSFSANSTTVSSNVPYVQLMTCIKQDAPAPGFIPRGASIYYAGLSCPTDWSPVNSSKGRFVTGLPRDARSAGTFGGNPLQPNEDRTHSHNYSSSVSLPSRTILAANGGPGANGYGRAGRYSFSGATSRVGSGIPYLQLLHCQKDAAGPPAIEAVLNGASFQTGAIASGQIISIFGSNLGPVEGNGTETDRDGRVTTRNSDVEVLINGDRAPLFFVREDQINLQVPYSVDGTSAMIQVIYEDIASESFRVPVATSSPGIFAYNELRDAVALHPDGSIVTNDNPARPGDIVAFYATGEGLTTPAGQSGRPAGQPLPAPLLPVRVTIGGRDARIEYAGAAPGFVGLMQVNIRLAPDTPQGYVDIEMTVGAMPSQRELRTYVRR